MTKTKAATAAPTESTKKVLANPAPKAEGAVAPAAGKEGLSREQRIELHNKLKAIAREFNLRESDMMFEASCVAFNDYIRLIENAAVQMVTDSNGDMPEDEVTSAVEQLKVSISTECGVPLTTKRNQITSDLMTKASIHLWKEYGEAIRAFFAARKKEKEGEA